MTDAERLEQLRKMLAAREGKPGYKRNCEHIRAAIVELEAAPTK